MLVFKKSIIQIRKVLIILKTFSIPSAVKSKITITIFNKGKSACDCIIFNLISKPEFTRINKHQKKEATKVAPPLL